MKRIFIAGPYTKGDVAKNVKSAMDVANDLIVIGFAPFCPHLTHFLHMNKWQPYETWLSLDAEFLRVCDGLLRIEGESNGADKEVELAKTLGIPVFHDLESLKGFYSN